MHPPGEQLRIRVFADLLATIDGENPNRNGLKDTPKRVARAFTEFTAGYNQTLENIIGDAIFQAPHDDMVVFTDLPVYSMCEHHVVPFFGKAQIAYIPNPKVGIVGLSKFQKIVEMYAQRLQVQERLTMQILSAIEKVAKPLGVAVILECRHLCMEMRGIKIRSSTITKKTSGTLNDPVVFDEFCKLIRLHHHKPLDLSFSRNIDTCCDIDEERHCNGIPEVPCFPAPEGCASALTQRDTERPHIYRLYQQCATDEASEIAKYVEEAAAGPLTESKPHGLSVLDIGAGDGRVLMALCNSNGTHKFEVGKYRAFETDSLLVSCLQVELDRNGFNETNSLIVKKLFTCKTAVDEAGGPADIVLLSHCLYGSDNKESILENALHFVAEGGILIVVHRWTPGGTLDKLCDYLNGRSIIHSVKIWSSGLQLSQLSPSERERMSRYTQGDVIATAENQNSVSRCMGYVAIEPHSGVLGSAETQARSVKEGKHHVGFHARRKNPKVVIKPNSVTGVAACIRAAATKSVGNGSIAVVGGGHSENSFAEDSIVIDMENWSSVHVNASKRLVRVGGGAKIGAITAECEKHSLMLGLGDRPGIGMGLILQGGLNHFMRKYGLATDNIVHVVYMDPSGALRTARSTKDLFHFKGAGSNFGVVLEITLRAFPMETIITGNTSYSLINNLGLGVGMTYSRLANTLDDNSSLDGYIYWSSFDQLSFATSYFRLQASLPTGNSLQHNIPKVSVKESCFEVQQGQVSEALPSDLPNRELYMTPAFAPERTLAPSQASPLKLRSMKRCPLLPELLPIHEKILFGAMAKSPSKWCYIHLIHGGGAVERVPASETAFGARKWAFAAVITSRWPDGDMDAENKACAWLERTTEALIPFSAGFYGADLTPADTKLARLAFGPNRLRLATLKQHADPLNIFRSVCPLTTYQPQDPQIFSNGVAVIFCGRRFAGKDWLAGIASRVLKELLGCTDHENQPAVSFASISDETKHEFAQENPNIDSSKLIRNHGYKEKHREALGVFYKRKCTQDAAYGAKCYLNCLERCNNGILLVTGMRDGLEYARRLANRPVVLVKVDASNGSKEARGWKFHSKIDDSPGECAADELPEAFWDLHYENNLESDESYATDWALQTLAPAILRHCTRHLTDTPKPGICFRDLVGSLLLQPFAMSLCSSLAVHRLGSESFDVIVAPEALGYVFAGAIAAKMNKPLVLARKHGKLPGDTVKVSYDGSNMSNLQKDDDDNSKGCNKDLLPVDQAQESLELIQGTIQPGHRILVVDDCLASGSTVTALRHLVELQGGRVTKLFCLMEFPDLQARQELIHQKMEIVSLMSFPGS